MSPSTLESATPERVLVEAAPRGRPALRRLRESWQRFRRHRTAMAGLSCWSRSSVLALAAPLLTSYNPERQSLSQALRPVSPGRTRSGPTISGATSWPGSSTAAGSPS